MLIAHDVDNNPSNGNETSDEVYGCLQCKFGYTGVVKNWEVEFCKTYLSGVTGCQICKNQYKLDSPHICTTFSGAKVSNCEWYHDHDEANCRKCVEEEGKTYFLEEVASK